jgi:secretion/DNA translocation related CpaE-like protein
VTRPRPLLVAHDPDLLDDALRAAAIAEVELDVAVDVVAARPHWDSAPVVLLDAGFAADLVDGGLRPPLPRRRRIILLCRGTPPALVRRYASAIGAESVLELPAAERTLVERLAEWAPAAASRARVVGVIGGCGGAGASTLAASLAQAAGRRPAGAMLVDLDPFGGGIDVALGLEAHLGLRWPDLTTVTGRLSPGALHAALPRLRGLAVLSCAPGGETQLRPGPVRAVLAAARDLAGVIVLDLPRPPSAAGMIGLDLADDVLLVVPADVRAIVAARQVASVLRPATDRVQAVVRPAAALSSRRVAEALALPLAGEMTAERRLRTAAGRGRPLSLRRRGPLSRLCERLLDGWGDLDGWRDQERTGPAAA